MRSKPGEEFIEMLLARLERIRADSCWAHQASGVRGALIRALDNANVKTPAGDLGVVKLTETAFQILLRAATERSRQDTAPYAAPRKAAAASSLADASMPETKTE